MDMMASPPRGALLSEYAEQVEQQNEKMQRRERRHGSLLGKRSTVNAGSSWRARGGVRALAFQRRARGGWKGRSGLWRERMWKRRAMEKEFAGGGVRLPGVPG